MSAPTDTGTGAVAADYFDDLYRRNSDPWNFAASGYEHAKYDATLAALPARRFARGLELGCSIGVLTERLAARCDSLLAIDVADTALATARRRLADVPNVSLAKMRVPDEWPRGGPFDLIVASEILYFLSETGINALARRVLDGVAAGGIVLLVHWLGATGTALGGDAATDLFLAAAHLPRSAALRTPGWRLDLLCAP